MALFTDEINDVVSELDRQFSIFGSQHDKTYYQWISVLGEEFGELCEAINETFTDAKHPDRGGYDNIYKEALHTAAVAIQIMNLAKRDTLINRIKRSFNAD